MFAFYFIVYVCFLFLLAYCYFQVTNLIRLVKKGFKLEPKAMVSMQNLIKIVSTFLCTGALKNPLTNTLIYRIYNEA